MMNKIFSNCRKESNVYNYIVFFINTIKQMNVSNLIFHKVMEWFQYSTSFLKKLYITLCRLTYCQDGGGLRLAIFSSCSPVKVLTTIACRNT